MSNKHLKIGPGGRNCSCCFTAPGSKDRRARYRISKRKADREAMKNAMNDIINHWAEMQDWLDEQKAMEEEANQYDNDLEGDYWRDDDLLTATSLPVNDDIYSHYLEEDYEEDFMWRRYSSMTR